MEAFIGTILPWPMNWAPQGWAICNGQQLPIAQNQALYALIGNYFGGNASTTFNLPDLRGRVPVGMGQGNGLSNINLAQVGGAENVTLNANQIPAHTHAATVTINAGKDTNLTNVATGKVLSSDAKGGDVPPMMYTDSANATTLRADAATAVVAAAGGGQAHSNMQPYLGMNYIICLQGIFPSRP